MAKFSFSSICLDESSENVKKLTESTIKNAPLYTEDDVYRMLQFNEDCRQINANMNMAIYKTYLESDGRYMSVVNEGVIRAILEAFRTVIQKIIDLLRGLVKGGGVAGAKDDAGDVADAVKAGANSVSTSVAEKQVKKCQKDVEYTRDRLSADPNLRNKDITISIDLIENFHKIYLYSFDKYCSEIIKEMNDAIKAGKEGNFDQIYTKSMKEMLNGLSNATPANYKEFGVAVGEAFKTSRIEGKAFDLWEKHVAQVRFTDMLSEIGDVEDKLNDGIKSLSRTMDDAKLVENADNSTKVANAAMATLTKLSQAYNLLLKSYLTAYQINCKAYQKVAKAFAIRPLKLGEATMFGEEFDGDTLYSEEDYRDFNRTDWVNLGLGEKYDDMANQGMIEEMAYLEECKLRVKEGTTIDDLYKLNEAVAEKAKAAMNTAIEKLKQLVAKFMEKLYSVFGSNKGYLDRYKKIILENDNPVGPFSSSGDIFVGMDRIMNVPVPLLNYSTMNGSLVDEATFFNNFCLTKDFKAHMNGGPYSRLKRRRDLDNYQPSNEGAMSIADFCKQYFGYGNDSYKNEWQFGDLNTDMMKRIFDFLYNVKDIKAAIEKDRKTIDDSLRRITNEINKTEKLASQGAATQTNTGTAAPKAEGAWSYVYQTYIHELDTKGAQQPAEAKSQTGGENQTVKNTTGTGYKDTNSAMQDIQNSKNNDADTVRKGMTVYLNVTRTILTAKMTALEFVRRELFDLLRFKVNFYVEKRNEQPKTTNQQQEEQNAQQQQTNQ